MKFNKIEIAYPKDFLFLRYSDEAKENFTKEELDYCFRHSQPQLHLAGIYCAKKAILGSLEHDAGLKEISIKHDTNGKPFALINRKPFNGDISISHTEKLAAAFAANEF